MSAPDRCPHCRRRPKKARRRRAQEAALWESVSAAIAVITAERGPGGYQVADLIGGQDPERVIRAQAIITASVLDALAPDAADRILRRVGLSAIRESTR